MILLKITTINSGENRKQQLPEGTEEQSKQDTFWGVSGETLCHRPWVSLRVLSRCAYDGRPWLLRTWPLLRTEFAVSKWGITQGLPETNNKLLHCITWKSSVPQTQCSCPVMYPTVQYRHPSGPTEPSVWDLRAREINASMWSPIILTVPGVIKPSFLTHEIVTGLFIGWEAG